ncbi:Transcriptional regulator containing GAF, AAA-type ATPase, and DNA-binding Fis domains [Mucilaginibacter pineti]|uniref:Transcriptional regulator containing GAF, AAA-type ATPase, and DNA-binding Fis domains n=1 Tax=Mucilaginibacter pineti TaxID=1391627 RepID=A0A1G6Z835_9SPHI|nr:sigma 54-interacting transcriptional regulator [Mucilaginibacter pineti]SDD98443.1 Transcriptional regulator containing GAF, AAA-type ATPase, and DNA-binding Fis domains [Mucilaginibacter pineti]
MNTIIETGKPVLVDVVKRYESTGLKILKVPYEEGMKEIASFGLFNGTEAFGSINFFSDRTDSFSPYNLSVIGTISNLVSIAVSNILANERIEQQLAEIDNYKKQLEEENLYLQGELTGKFAQTEIIGTGNEMQKVFHLLTQVSYANSAVLLLGETGTGKELIARAIHNNSPRKEKLMVKVNCAGLPANLIESELFGHERGSFTGAVERRIGKFELANKGTLFLDEIGEMPLDLQVKLLRAIQEKEIGRIGGKMPIKVDIRIIAATNRDLPKEIVAGNFRSDLYYRLNVFPITLPPLRNRTGDIPDLALHFLSKYARNIGKKVHSISNRVLAEMKRYSWPGNVRELEHLMERSVLLTEGNVIREIYLPNHEMNGTTGFPAESYTKTIDENERDHIIARLNKCDGKVYGSFGAASLLGVPVSTLNSKMRKLRIGKEKPVFIVRPV